MSPEGDDGPPGSSKRRKVPRACDYCRKRKIRCDGPMRGGSSTGATAKCTHCAEMGFECTYLKEAQRKGPPRGYVVMLQERCARLENLVHQLRPGIDIETNVGPPLDYDTFDVDAYRARLSALDIPPFPKCKRFVATDMARPPGGAGASGPYGTVGSGSGLLGGGIGAGAAGTPGSSTSAVSASSVRPIPTRLPTVDLLPAGRLVPDMGGVSSPASESSRVTGEDTPDPFLVTTSVSSMISSDNTSLQYFGKTATLNLMRGLSPPDLSTMERELERVKVRRSKLWKKPEWEVVVNNTGQRLVDWTIWPEDDLALTLIEAYFEWVNCTVPLLHRPLFRQQYFARLYMTDYDFAKLCLTVFANGSRFVYAPLAQWRRAQDVGHLTASERPNDGVVFSDGWKFIRGLMSAGDSLHRAPTLFRLQTAVLLATFMHGNTDQTIPWAIAGNALRAAQEIGLHLEGADEATNRRRSAATGTSGELTTLGASGAERQLLLRAFWCLYSIDRSCCASLGRSVALTDADIGAAYPLDVDDEWEGSDELAPPPGASKVHAFMQSLQLDRIVSAAIATLPARRDARDASATRLPAALIELAAALNHWSTNLPRQLRWEAPDPAKPEYPRNTAHFIRTAHLHARYHWVRIFVHWAPLAARASSSGDTGLDREIRAPGTRPVLDIVLESAAEIFSVCAALLAHEVFAPATQRPIPFQFIDYAWVAGAVTVLGLRAGSLRGHGPDAVEAAFNGIATAIATMQQMECVSRNAGQVADLLSVMASVARSSMPTDEQPVVETTASTTKDITGDATPVLRDHGTPDLSWLGDAIFMPPLYASSAATPTASATAPAEGTGEWAQLFESFVLNSNAGSSHSHGAGGHQP